MAMAVVCSVLLCTGVTAYSADRVRNPIPLRHMFGVNLWSVSSLKRAVSAKRAAAPQRARACSLWLPELRITSVECCQCDVFSMHTIKQHQHSEHEDCSPLPA